MTWRHAIGTLSIASIVLTAGCSTSGPSAAPTTSAAPTSTEAMGTVPGLTGETPCPPSDGSAPATIHFEKAPPVCTDPAKSYAATVETTAGNFTIRLDAARSPSNVNNFVVLARYHYFDGLPLDQVAPGDYFGTGVHPPPASPDPGYRIPSETATERADYQRAGTVIIDTEQTEDNGGVFIVLLTDKGVAPRFTILGHVSAETDVTQAIDRAASAAVTNTASTAAPGVPTIVRVTISES